MSHNPTYDPEPGYNPSSAPEFSNMASYRQATEGPPQSMFAPVGGDGNGKSYRYATDAIPEDEEADEPKGVQFSNGGEPTKSYSSGEKESFWDKHKVIILVALAVLFALLFVVFAGLYGKAMSDLSNMGTATTPRTGAIKDTVTAETPTTTTVAPVAETILGTYSGPGEAQVKKYVLTNEGKVEVELLSIGARINKFMVNNVDIVLGFGTDPNTVNLTDISKQTYGATHGRVCRNFGLPIQYNGQSYTPQDQNLYMKNFKAERVAEGVKFSTTVTSNDDNLPGSVDINVVYSLNNANQLTVRMSGKSSDNTLIDLCNAASFNLNGNQQSVLNHQMMVNAYQFYFPSTNAWRDIGNGIYNFNSLKSLQGQVDIARQSDDALPQFSYDYLISGASGMRHAMTLSGNNIELKVHTNQAAMEFLVPLKGTTVVSGKNTYGDESAVEVKTFSNPLMNSQNILLKPASTYESVVQYSV